MPVDHGVEELLRSVARRSDRHARRKLGTATQDATSFAQRRLQVGHELEAVPTRGGVKRSVAKRKLLDVHDLEARAWDLARASHLDHSRREVDADDLAAGSGQRGEPAGEVAGPARQVEDAHPVAGRVPRLAT